MVFLPARAAAVAMALSSLSSFAAVAMLVRVRRSSWHSFTASLKTHCSQLALALSEISGEDIFLVACCASAFGIFVVASLTLAVSPRPHVSTLLLIPASRSMLASCLRRSAGSGSSFHLSFRSSLSVMSLLSQLYNPQACSAGHVVRGLGLVDCAFRRGPASLHVLVRYVSKLTLRVLLTF